MRAIGIAFALLASSGCAKILGLDDTTLEHLDAPTDTPSVCDGQPACNHSGGNSLCGQLFSTGTDAPAPIRVANPTGAFCAGPATDGPCAFTVAAMSASSYFGGSTNSTAGQMDDCGRFVVPDIDSSITDAAVFFSNQNAFKNNATIVTGLTPVTGVNSKLEAYAVSDATAMAWSTQLTTTQPAVDTSAGYLVRYTRITTPVVDEQVAKDMGAPLTSMPGSTPWGAYFATPFGTLDPALTATKDNGTAIAVFGSGSTFSLEGLHPGKRCRVIGLQQLSNTYIFVLPTDC